VNIRCRLVKKSGIPKCLGVELVMLRMEHTRYSGNYIVSGIKKKFDGKYTICIMEEQLDKSPQMTIIKIDRVQPAPLRLTRSILLGVV
jgi:hypothetical protein